MNINPNLTESLEDLKECERTLNYDFENRSYLIQALLHSSMFDGVKSKLSLFKQQNNLANDNYEKLEYIGDSALHLIIADYFYTKPEIEEYARANNMSIEQTLTNVKNVLGSNERLLPVACKLNLDKYTLRGNSVDVRTI